MKMQRNRFPTSDCNILINQYKLQKEQNAFCLNQCHHTHTNKYTQITNNGRNTLILSLKYYTQILLSKSIKVHMKDNFCIKNVTVWSAV